MNIAIPEQLAISQLAGMPLLVTLIAFIGVILVFVVVGANRIRSARGWSNEVGGDGGGSARKTVVAIGG